MQGVYLEARGLRDPRRADQKRRLEVALRAAARTDAVRLATSGRRVSILIGIEADDEFAALVDAERLIDAASRRSAPGLLADLVALTVRIPPRVQGS